jgi:hypothetical protein
MNFSRLPKPKRNQLFLVAGITVVILGGLGFGLIKWQYANLRALDDKQQVAEKKLARVADAIKHADQIEANYDAKRQLLAEQEEGMASGDLFSWLVNTLRTFKLDYRVDIPQISQPTTPDAVNLLPDFPFKQVTLKIGGTAYYQDLGEFVADFENHFPHIRLVNLTLEPAAGVGGALASADKEKVDKEKLSFTVDVVTLVKPNTP